MSLRLGDTAPDFTAKTTEGEINFYEFLGDSWSVLFSHPADYTPVCTTELGRTALLKEEFKEEIATVERSEQRLCTRCGLPASHTVCSACQLITRIGKNEM